MKMRIQNVIFGAMLMILLTACAGYADLSDGLVAYYPFNGNANDESGNNHHGNAACPTLTADRLGNLNSAYSFDGANDYIWIPGDADFSVSHVSISLWVNVDPAASSSYAFCNDNFYRGYNLLATPDYLHFNVGNGNWHNVHSDIMPANRWVHIAGTFDGTRLNLFRDGQNVGTTFWTGVINTGGIRNLQIGRNAWYLTGYFKGAIDDIRLYNRALSESEIQQLAGTAIAATIDIDPDTLNLGSKDKWVTCYIELPDGYDVMDVYGSTVMLEGIPAYIGTEGWARSGANSGNIMDHDGDGIRERMVKFDKSAVQDYLIGLGLSDYVVLTVTGDLVDGPSFEGIDVIRVIDEGSGK